MEIVSSMPFIKLHRNQSALKIRSKSPCIISQGDMYLNNEDKWVDDIDGAKIGSLAEMYEQALKIKNRNKLVLLILKL